MMGNSAAKFDLPAFLMLLLSGLGLLGILTAAAGLAFAGLFALLAGGALGDRALPILSLAWAAVFFCLLLLPSLINAFIRLLNLNRPTIGLPHRLRLASLFMLFFPALVVSGDYLSLQSDFSWLLLPPLQILVTVIPIWWIFEVGRRGLTMSERRRGWGLVSFNMLINQPLILVAEIGLFLILGALAALWLSGRPELFGELQRLAQRVADAGMDPAALQRMLLPFLQQPLVLLGILVMAAGLIPMLEELLKPLALWGLAGRGGFTPVDGFVGGMLCGATFALMETLGNLSNPLDLWAAVVVGRFGTALLHITTSGLVGWGLASALAEEKYARLGAGYLLAVGLHALWNVFGIMVGISPLIDGADAPAFVVLNQRLGMVAPLAMAALTATLFLILLGSNRRLRKASRPAGEDGVVEAVGPLGAENESV
ncbi:MAG: PrsW family intramembrane metalloprotease [Anaerolineae bacterium]|nr:PrsW family intramembrane metalloprotease [Anaerolineae bacterium]